MKNALSRIQQHMFDILGLDRMNKSFRLLALSYVFVMFYFTFESVFINTLLYRVNEDGMRAVIIYRSISFISIGIFMQVAAYLSHKASPLFIVRLGATLYLAIFAILFFGINHIGALQHFLAAFGGVGAAFYWMGHNLLLTNYTSKANRDTAMSIMGIVQGIMTLFIPVISGFVISLMPEISGYRVMFFVSTIMVLVHLACLRRFKPIEGIKHKSQLKLAIKLLYRRLTFRYMLVYDYFRGVRDGTFAFFLNMVLFSIISDESIIGINTFLTGTMAITGSWVYGKLVRQNNRFRYGVLGTTVLMAGCSILFFNMSVPTVMFFTVINAFMQLFFQYGFNNTSFDAIAETKLSRECTAEIVGLRELVIMFGRLTGLTITLLVPPSQTGYVLVMLLLTFTQYIAMLFVKLVLNILNRKQNKSVGEVV